MIEVQRTTINRMEETRQRRPETCRSERSGGAVTGFPSQRLSGGLCLMKDSVAKPAKLPECLTPLLPSQQAE